MTTTEHQPQSSGGGGSNLSKVVADISSTSLLSHPFSLGLAFLRALLQGTVGVARNLAAQPSRTASLALLVACAVGFVLSPPTHLSETRDVLVNNGSFALYWVTLGVLSSIGLGE